ncbi:MAG: MSMEG_0565 family glycosyltransferase [Cyanobacteria bacterium Co-bin13]|nr:MSMEG_0565 family glycosyltransferase [Cyanobacteria bacterium Co-bin13]
MTDSLRIALLTYSTKPRGSVIHTLELARALKTLGHQPSVFGLDKDGQGFGQTLPFETYSVRASPYEGGIDELIRHRIEEFVRYFEQHGTDYDIFHAQDCIGANALAALRQQGRIPHFVRTVHHVEAFESPYLQDCQDRSIRLPDLCLCVSQLWQEVLWADYGIRAGRVFNGVDTVRFSPTPDGTEAALASSLNLTGGPVYLTVGGIEPRKNSIRLLQAFAQVLKQFPEAQLVIAGGATLFDYQPYRRAFLKTAGELGIRQGESLILPGVIADRDLPALYRLADAFVFPSLKEGWGLVVLEAIATHLPILTANQAPFTEFLTPQQTLFVQPDNSDSIAAAMLKITHPDIIHSLVQNSRSIAQAYSWTTSAKLHLQHYLSLKPNPQTPN